MLFLTWLCLLPRCNVVPFSWRNPTSKDLVAKSRFEITKASHDSLPKGRSASADLARVNRSRVLTVADAVIRPCLLKKACSGNPVPSTWDMTMQETCLRCATLSMIDGTFLTMMVCNVVVFVRSIARRATVMEMGII